MKVRYDYDLLALQLDDFLWPVGRPDSRLAEVYEMRDALGVPLDTTRRTIHYHRDTYSTTNRALIVHPTINGRHLYSISVDPEEITRWALRRINDGYTRFKTIQKEMEVAVNLVDGRTVIGAKCNKIKKFTGRMVQDIEELDEELTRMGKRPA